MVAEIEDAKTEEKSVVDLVADDVVQRIEPAQLTHVPLGAAYAQVLQLACSMREELERRGSAPLYAVISAAKRGKQDIALVESYEDAEKTVKQPLWKGSTIHVVTPVGDARERKGQELAAGLAEEMLQLRRELTEAKAAAAMHAQSADEVAVEAGELRKDLQALRNDIDKQVIENTAKERAALTTAREVRYLNDLRQEVATSRETIRRLEMALAAAKDGNKDEAAKHENVVQQSQLASQIEAVVRVANGQPCPEMGAYNWSSAARAADLLWQSKHALMDRVRAAVAELELPPGGANAAIAARAAKAILEDALEEKPT